MAFRKVKDTHSQWVYSLYIFEQQLWFYRDWSVYCFQNIIVIVIKVIEVLELLKSLKFSFVELRILHISNVLEILEDFWNFEVVEVMKFWSFEVISLCIFFYVLVCEVYHHNFYSLGRVIKKHQNSWMRNKGKLMTLLSVSDWLVFLFIALLVIILTTNLTILLNERKLWLGRQANFIMRVRRPCIGKAMFCF